MTFETVRNNFKRGLWNETMVRMAVKKGIITKEQFVEIVGKSF